MDERQSGSGPLLGESILYVVDRSIGHGQRAAELQKLGRLDHLNVAPQVPRVVAEISEPPAPWPRLKLHRHRLAVGHFATGPELFEQGLKRNAHRGLDVDFLVDVQQEFRGHGCSAGHGFHSWSWAESR